MTTHSPSLLPAPLSERRTGQETRPLVVLSSRGPYARREVRGVSQWARTVGGLVSALDPAVRARGGVWISSAETRTDDEPVETPPKDLVGYDTGVVPLSPSEVEGYYRRVANGVLWPLLHSMPTRVQTHGAPWEVFTEVNARFARAAALAPDDATFWIQDFQLVLVPGQLRRLRPASPIGFFNHIPFPAPEILATLPERDALMDGLLGADLLGFQTSRDARNFLASVAELTPYSVDMESGTVSVAGRIVRASAFPIGIDMEAVQQISSDPDVRAQRERMRGDFGNVQILLSVDRLDYTKGLPERLHTFETLLEQHPNLVRRVSLVQVAVPSRIEVPQYAQLKREVDELVGQINGRFARPGWTPIHYLYRSLDLSALVALYGLADVALITPLRDGMNLVAHEFAAARLDQRGVLVLSEFAGAATILDGAVLVNPYDYPRTADTIASALSMSPEQQEERMRRLNSAVRRHKVSFWQQAFLTALESIDRAPQSTRH